MSAIGARYKWQSGKILHASRYWKPPTKRRIPRILIEDRALEVGILMYVEEPWMVFKETILKAEEISLKNAVRVEFYYGRYHLLPAKFRDEDAYEWLTKKPQAFLLWGKENRYFVKAATR